MAGATRRLHANSWRLCTRVEKRQVLHCVLRALSVYLFGRGGPHPSVQTYRAQGNDGF